MKKKAKFNLQSAIKSALRKIFSRSAFTRDVVNPVLDAVREEVWIPTKNGKSKKKRVYFTCAKCGKKEPRSNIAIDHIEPVVDIEGFKTWDQYIERMFCDAKNLQALCGVCHEEKSKKEREARKAYKATHL